MKDKNYNWKVIICFNGDNFYITYWSNHYYILINKYNKNKFTCFWSSLSIIVMFLSSETFSEHSVIFSPRIFRFSSVWSGFSGGCKISPHCEVVEWLNSKVNLYILKKCPKKRENFSNFLPKWDGQGWLWKKEKLKISHAWRF